MRSERESWQDCDDEETEHLLRPSIRMTVTELSVDWQQQQQHHLSR